MFMKLECLLKSAQTKNYMWHSPVDQFNKGTSMLRYLPTHKLRRQIPESSFLIN